MPRIGVSSACGVVVAVLAVSLTSTSAQRPRTFELRHASWFNGRSFEAQTKYVVAGRLTRQRPLRVDEIIDLTGLYVVPPLGDAHTHHFDNPQTTPHLIWRYLDEGTFYAKVVTEPRSRALLAMPLVNRADAVDVVYAHGGLTSSFSHPIEVYEAVALGYMTIDQQRAHGGEVRASRIREGDAYYIIDSITELESKWPQILAGKPGLIKVYLRDAECYHSSGWPKNPGTWNYSAGGVAPELVPEIIKRAHAAGLRVTAAVNTAFDTHVALASGADEISHLPGYQGLGSACGEVSHHISEWNAKLASDRGVDFVLVSSEYLVSHRPEVDQNTAANIASLRKWGVTLAIGSDSYGSSPREGVLAMAAQHVLEPRELLRIWSMNTPKVIFPRRSVGCVDDGCEASFVALGCNPLEDFACVKMIRVSMKDGVLRSPHATPPVLGFHNLVLAGAPRLG